MKRTEAKSTQSSRRLHSSCEYDSGVVSIAVYHTSRLHAQPLSPHSNSHLQACSHGELKICVPYSNLWDAIVKFESNFLILMRYLRL